MGKASRNRAANGRPNTGAPASSVFPNFPYALKFTKEEVADILDRAQRFGDLMRDGVGPSGATLFIPGDVFEMWMVHGILAGADGGKAYIRARRLPEETGRLEGAVEWVLIKEDTPEARAADAEREADAYLRALEDTRIRPEVRAAIRRRMKAAALDAEEHLGDDPDADARRDQPRDFGAPRLLEFRDNPDEETP